MAATQCERVPSLRGYRDSLSAENRQMCDEKLKFTADADYSLYLLYMTPLKNTELF